MLGRIILGLLQPATIKWIATPVAVLLSAGVVWQASNAAFSARTDNSGNTWNAAGIALADDDSNGAMFTVTNLKPGDTNSRCIKVTYTGTVATSVKFYSEAFSQTNALADNIDLSIQYGDGSGTFAGGTCTLTSPQTVYTGTLGSLGTSNTNYASGASGAWAAASSGAKVYKVTYTMKSAAPDTTQNGTAAARFVWEAQS